MVALAIDPQAPSTLYAGGYGLYKSIDSGASWGVLNTGLDHPIVLSLAIDPQVPSNLYVGVMQGGVRLIRQDY